MLVDRWVPARGGAERALEALVGRLVADGHAVEVFGLSAAEDAPGRFHPVPVPPLPRGDLERALARSSMEAARAAGCDVTLGVRHLAEVDVHWPHGGLHAATLAAGERARGPLTGTVSRLLHHASRRHRAFLDLERELLDGGGARRVWCVSALVREEIAAAYPAREGDLELHPNGVDRERFHPRLRETHREGLLAGLGLAGASGPVMLFPGGGNLRLKGWPLLLRALAGLAREPWSLLVPTPRAAAVRRGADRAGLAGRVHALPVGAPGPLYGAADLLVQPTWRDPCSLSTLEALAAGVPVLTTSANGAAEAVTTGEAGTVVPPGAPEAFHRALANWHASLREPGFRERASRAARASTRGRDADPWLGRLVASLGDSCDPGRMADA